jgi:anti-anti-sigma factor
VTQLDFLGYVDTSELTRGVFVVSAHGPTDGRVAAELRDALVPVAAADDSVVVLDLADAHGLDESVIEVIARAAHLVRKRGERLSVITRSSALLELAHGCGLDDVVSFHSSLQEAIAGD